MDALASSAVSGFLALFKRAIENACVYFLVGSTVSCFYTMMIGPLGASCCVYQSEVCFHCLQNVNVKQRLSSLQPREREKALLHKH